MTDLSLVNKSAFHLLQISIWIKPRPREKTEVFLASKLENRRSLICIMKRASMGGVTLVPRNVSDFCMAKQFFSIPFFCWAYISPPLLDPFWYSNHAVVEFVVKARSRYNSRFSPWKMSWAVMQFGTKADISSFCFPLFFPGPHSLQLYWRIRPPF